MKKQLKSSVQEGRSAYMPKDRKKLMSDGELSEMFLNIGRAKEAVAEGIIAEQKR